MVKLLLVDDHWQEVQPLLSRLPSHIEVLCEDDGVRALRRLMVDPAIATVLLDLKFDAQAKQGEQILREIKEQHPGLPVIILTSIGDVELALRLVHKEKVAHYYFFKDRIDPDQLAKEIENAVVFYTLRSDAIRSTGGDLIIGSSRALKAVLDLAARASQSDRPVLITGETGTGKELFARAIHLSSRRKGKAIVSVNCGAFPETLIESELFGHRKGAFTGAINERKGLFELADGGTIFLDEIGELPLTQQVKLLRVLDTGEIQKVGSDRIMRVDVRVVAATNRDLAAAIREKSFREDLYFRLNVIPIHLPPLRERKEDIPELVRHILDVRLGGHVGISEDAMANLCEYDWPGNVRRLGNVLERAALTATGNVLEVTDVASLLDTTSRGGGSPIDQWIARVVSGQVKWGDLRQEFKGTSVTLRDILDGVIRRWITERGERPSGNELAALLGITRTHVNVILDQVELKLRDYS